MYTIKKGFNMKIPDDDELKRTGVLCDTSTDSKTVCQPLCQKKNNVYSREGCQARSKAPGSGPGHAGVRAFESLPSHNLIIF